MCCTRFIYDCTYTITSFIKEVYYEFKMDQDERKNNCDPEEIVKLVNDNSRDVDEGFELV
jgi:hypothetical protein